MLSRIPCSQHLHERERMRHGSPRHIFLRPPFVKQQLVSNHLYVFVTSTGYIYSFKNNLLILQIIRYADINRNFITMLGHPLFSVCFVLFYHPVLLSLSDIVLYFSGNYRQMVLHYHLFLITPYQILQN